MSSNGHEGPARAVPGLDGPHHRSWGSDDFQKLLATHFGGNDDNLPPSEVSPLLRLTTDGAMLSELLQTLEGGDVSMSGAPGHVLFSQDTINRILGQQMAEAAAANGAAAPAPTPMQQQGSADLQTAGSGQSATSVHNSATKMSLQEATVAMQAAHGTSPMQIVPPHAQHAQHAPVPATIPQLVAVPTLSPQLTAVVPSHSPSGAGVPTAAHGLPPPPLPAPHMHAQQYVAVVDGRVLQQPDGTAVLASLPPAAPAAVALSGTNQVLQYIPVLGSQVITIPQASAAPQTFTPPFSGSPADGPMPMLSAVRVPPPNAATPPTTTPTSAAAATAAIYTSEISATQQLVAAAAVQQQMLRQEVAAMVTQQQTLSGGGGNSGPIPMVTSRSTGATATSISSGGGSGPVNLTMPPPPPRPARRSAEFAALQAPTLTPQLRPAAAAPNAGAMAALAAQQATQTAAVTPPPAPVPTLRPVATAPTPAASTATLELTPASAGAPTPTPANDAAAMPPPPPRAPSAMDLMRSLMQADERASAEVKAKAAAAAAAANADAPSTDLPRRPSHKRERSLRSASPLLADPSTAPLAKVAKGNSAEDGGGSGATSSDGSDAVADAILNSSTLGSSPDSCLLGAAVAGSAAPSSGGGSPLGAGYSSALPSPPVPAPGPDSVDRSISADTIAAMAAALAPKPGSKRRGRPPKVASPTAADGAEPSDAEILESLLREDPSRQSLPVEEIKRLVRKAKNRAAAAASRTRVQTHTAALEGQVAKLQAEQAHLAAWLAGPAAAAANAKPPVRHLSL